MAKIYELPKQLHPDFSDPRRKPTGPVELLKKGDAWLFNNSYSSVDGYGKTSGSATDAFGSNTDGLYYFNSSFGGSVTLSGKAGNVYCVVYRFTLDRADITSATSSYTLFKVGDFQIQIGANTGFMTGETVTYYDQTNAAKKSGIGSTISQGVNTLVWRFNGTRYDTFLNGNFVSPLSSSSEVDAIIPAGNVVVYSYNGISGPQNLSHFLQVVTEPVSYAQALNLSASPYQLLKPAIPLFYTVAGAGGGAYTLTADSGSFTQSGTAANLLFNRYLGANAGSYTLSGTDASLERGWTITADAGSFNLSGTDASLEFGRYLSAAAGSYTLSGTDADLLYGSGYTLTAEAGSFTVSGTAASLLFDRILTADTGSYTLNGTAATLARGWTITANAGSYTYTGTDAALLFKAVLSAEAGSYSIVGPDTTLTYSGAAVWTVQPDSSDTWSTQANSADTWTVKTESTDTWTVN